jgi:hypothetical protein
MHYSLKVIWPPLRRVNRWVPLIGSAHHTTPSLYLAPILRRQGSKAATYLAQSTTLINDINDGWALVHVHDLSSWAGPKPPVAMAITVISIQRPSSTRVVGPGKIGDA